MKSIFVQGYEIKELIKKAEEIKASGREYSDVTDIEGHQYVDLVQEGGGMLGIALVGYTFILEQAGIRFYSLAGTSAGSINALLMAGLSKPGESTSLKVIEVMGGKNFFDFVDGPSGIKRLIQKKIEGKSGIWRGLVFNSIRIFNLLRSKLGLNPGEAFEKWLTGILKENGIENLKDLTEKRNRLPKLQNRLNPDMEFKPPKLCIITSEITTHTKVTFPSMAGLYWEDPDQVSPSKFVRASMSIPFFYYPYTLNNIPNHGKVLDGNWIEQASYSGEVPETVKFVDGGMISNFPINTFHINGIPSRPTFGVRLSTYRDSYSNTNSIFSFSGAMISTMRQIHDYDFILKNPDYKQLICQIDADEDFNWLDFNMSEERQSELFLLGARKGIEFLENFNWEDYKKIRSAT